MNECIKVTRLVARNAYSFQCMGCGKTWRSQKPETKHHCNIACLQFGIPYITLLGDNKYLWQCRRCDWMLTTDNDLPVAHRCGMKQCRHQQEQTPSIRIACCSDTEREYPTNKCDLHGRCIPAFDPNGKALAKWRNRKPESDIYTLCLQCGDFEQ